MHGALDLKTTRRLLASFSAKPTGRAPYLAAKKESRIIARLEHHRRDAMIQATIEILDGWHASKFQFEGPCRHGLRAGLCLDGESWAVADKIAAEVISEALHVLGAARPSWQEGQQEWTQDGYAPQERWHCKHCGKPLTLHDEPQSGNVRQFCDEFCRNHHRIKLISSLKRSVGRAEVAATLAALAKRRNENSDIAHTIFCEACGKPFMSGRRVKGEPMKMGKRFCSKKCANSRALRYPEQTCLQCRKTFTPARKNQNFCSRYCNDRACKDRRRERAGFACEPVAE